MSAYQPPQPHDYSTYMNNNDNNNNDGNNDDNNNQFNQAQAQQVYNNMNNNNIHQRPQQQAAYVQPIAFQNQPTQHANMNMNHAYGQQQQQQQQQQGGNPMQFNMMPGFDQGLNTIGKIGAFYGQQFYEEKARGWFSFFSLSHLRYYFHVNNSYVLNKIKILLLPFVHKNWKRLEADAQSSHTGTGYKYPKHDINAPDLYIPLMAFITYILLYGLTLGVYHRFDPEILGLNASSAFLILIFEVLLMKLGFYLLGDQAVKPPLLDLIAYSSYKYVGCIVALLIGVLFGSRAHLFSGIFTSIMMAIYMMRTIKRAAQPKTAQLSSNVSKRNYFLLLLGILQIFTCWILGRGAIP